MLLHQRVWTTIDFEEMKTWDYLTESQKVS
jgi:hypothetical protein